MKKMLITLFIVLIMGFGSLGYTHTTTDTNEIVNDHGHAVTIQS